MGGNSENWKPLRYLVALALALTVVSAIPADANVQEPVPTTVQVVKARQAPPEPVIPPAIMAKWEKVAQCETGSNWHAKGPIYSGGLGFRYSSWNGYGGLVFAPTAAEATPAEQVYVAINIQKQNGFGGYVPDQNGTCSTW